MKDLLSVENIQIIYQTPKEETMAVKGVSFKVGQENKTMVMVTHDIPEAVAMSDTVIVLSPRPAKVDFGDIIYNNCAEKAQ